MKKIIHFLKIWFPWAFDLRPRCPSCKSLLEYREGRTRDHTSPTHGYKWVEHMVCPKHNWGFEMNKEDRAYFKGELIT